MRTASFLLALSMLGWNLAFNIIIVAGGKNAIQTARFGSKHFVGMWTTNPSGNDLAHTNGLTVAFSYEDFVPFIITAILTVYFGMALFNYGTRKSYRVHAMNINPWAWLLIGSIVLVVGGVMPPSVARYSADFGMIFFLYALLASQNEVAKDIKHGTDFQISINSAISEIQRFSQLSQQNHQQYQQYIRGGTNTSSNKTFGVEPFQEEDEDDYARNEGQHWEDEQANDNSLSGHSKNKTSGTTVEKKVSRGDSSSSSLLPSNTNSSTTNPGLPSIGGDNIEVQISIVEKMMDIRNDIDTPKVTKHKHKKTDTFTSCLGEDSDLDEDRNRILKDKTTEKESLINTGDGTSIDTPDTTINIQGIMTALDEIEKEEGDREQE
eukprot:g2876.t1